MTNLTSSLNCRMVEHIQVNKLINRISRLKGKNCIVISIDLEQAFDKNQHAFMIKVLENVGIAGIYHNVVKAIYEKPTVNIILSREKLEAIPLESGMRQGCPLWPLLFNTVLAKY